MSTFSGPEQRRAASVVGGALVCLLALTACAVGKDEPAPAGKSPEATTLGSLGELDDLTMIDTSWPRYRTAKVTGVVGRPQTRVLDVTYEDSDATCESLAGFAARRTDEKVHVTLVLGAAEDCSPGTAAEAVTSLPLSEPLGAVTPVVSKYSKDSLPIG